MPNRFSLRPPHIVKPRVGGGMSGIVWVGWFLGLARRRGEESCVPRAGVWV